MKIIAFSILSINNINDRLYVLLFSEYLLTVGTKDEQHNFQFYHANITKLDNGSRIGPEQVKIAIDKFSPKETLEGISFFIISENTYKHDFYLGLNDIVMKLPGKLRTFRKRFKKIQRKCKRSSNPSSRRKRRHRARSWKIKVFQETDINLLRLYIKLRKGLYRSQLCLTEVLRTATDNIKVLIILRNGLIWLQIF